MDLCEKGHQTEKAIVVKRLDKFDVPMKAGRDTWWNEEMAAPDSRTNAQQSRWIQGSPLHPLYIGVDRQAEGRHAHHWRLHGSHHHVQMDLRLQGKGNLLVYRGHQLGNRPFSSFTVLSPMVRRRIVLKASLRIRSLTGSGRSSEIQGQYLTQRRQLSDRVVEGDK